MNDLYSTGQVARQLGLQRYQLEYLIEIGAVDDTPQRVAGKRVWIPEQVQAIRDIINRRAGTVAREAKP